MLINIAINCEIIKHSRGYTLQRKTKLRKNRYKTYAKSTQQMLFISLILTRSKVKDHSKLSFVSDLSLNWQWLLKTQCLSIYFYLKCSPIYLFLGKVRNLNEVITDVKIHWIRKNVQNEATKLLFSKPKRDDNHLLKDRAVGSAHKT